MSTQTLMNNAMQYIENHLLDKLNYHEIAATAGCSEYHFRRMFSYLAGISLSEYIRRRRLTCAAAELTANDCRIIDIALKYGYESADSFCKAFQNIHGTLPSQAKNDGSQLKAFPPLTFQLTIQGGIEMNYRIVEKPAFYIIGFKKQITLLFSGENPQMQSLVEKLTPDIIRELKSLCDTEPSGILNVSANFKDRMEEGSRLDQYIGVAVSKECSTSYDILAVDAASWAVFSARGKYPDALQDIWARIYAEWLPTSGYELIAGPEILWNEGPDTSKPDYKSEIWIPVRKL